MPDKSALRKQPGLKAQWDEMVEQAASDNPALRKRVRGWCGCDGNRRKIMDSTDRVPDAGDWARAFVNAHGEHDGFRLVVDG